MAKDTRDRRKRGRKAERPGREAARGGARPGRPAATLRFTMVNALFGGAGVATVILGYLLLAQGSITAAPILLTLGYVVLLPIAIVK